MIAGDQQNGGDLKVLLDTGPSQKIYDYVSLLRDDQIALSFALKVQNSRGQNAIMLLLQIQDLSQFLDLWPSIDSCRGTPQVLAQLDNDGRSILHYAVERHEIKVVHAVLQSIRNHIGANSIQALYQGSNKNPNNLLIYMATIASVATSEHDAKIFKEVTNCFGDFFGKDPLCSLIFSTNASDDDTMTTAIQYEGYEICYMILQILIEMPAESRIKKEAMIGIYGRKNMHGYSAFMLSILNYHSVNSDDSKKLCQRFIQFILDVNATTSLSDGQKQPDIINSQENLGQEQVVGARNLLGKNSERRGLGEYTVSNSPKLNRANNLDAGAYDRVNSISTSESILLEQIIKCPDKDNQNALMILVILRMHDLLSSLLNLISNDKASIELSITTRSGAGDNLLMLAMRCDNTFALQAIADTILKQLGPDGLARTLSADAFDIAASSNDDNMIRLVTEYLKASGLYQKASSSGKIDNFLTARNSAGETALMRAINSNDKGTCDVIMDIAKDTNKLQKILLLCSVDKNGNTPVTMANSNGEMIKMIDDFAKTHDVSFYVQYQLQRMKKAQEYKEFFLKVRGY